MPITTARAAPPVTPRMPGSASGLRVTACIVVPAIASAAPTRIARTVRGIRATTAACETPSTSPAESGEDLADADLAHAERDRCDAQQEEGQDRSGEPRQTHRRRAPQRSGVRQRCARLRGGQGDSAQCAREQGEVLVDAPADRERRRVRRRGKRRGVLEDRDPTVRDRRDLREQRIGLQLLDDRRRRLRRTSRTRRRRRTGRPLRC